MLDFDFIVITDIRPEFHFSDDEKRPLDAIVGPLPARHDGSRELGKIVTGRAARDISTITGIGKFLFVENFCGGFGIRALAVGGFLLTDEVDGKMANATDTSRYLPSEFGGAIHGDTGGFKFDSGRRAEDGEETIGAVEDTADANEDKGSDENSEKPFRVIA